MSFHAAPASFDSCTTSALTTLGSGLGRNLAAEAARPLPSATHGVDPQHLALRYAGERRIDVAWALYGAPERPLVVVQGGISAHRHVCASTVDPAEGWWEAQVGPGRAIDTARYSVLAIDWVGADDRIDVPVDGADQADAIAALLDLFGIERAHAFVGASYGAMVALQFAARHGARVQHTIALSGAHRAHPQATALRVVQRRIVALGRRSGCAAEALALARQLAMLGYRTPAELAQRFGAAPQYRAGGFAFDCEAWLDACGARFVERFRPGAFVRLSESIDLHRVDPAAIRGRVTLVGVEQDQIVPIAELEDLQRALGPACTLRRFHSIYGHDAFLKEPATIDALLRTALAGDARGAA